MKKYFLLALIPCVFLTSCATFAGLFGLQDNSAEWKKERIVIVPDTDIVSSEIYIPVFSSQDLKPLNDEINNCVKRNFKTFLQNVNEYEKYSDMDEYQIYYRYNTDFEVSFYKDYINVTFYFWQYLGGAHGNTTVYTLNYDKKQKRLTDICEATGLNLDELCLGCRADLFDELEKETGRSDPLFGFYTDWIKTGTKALPENYKTFTFVKKNGKNYVSVIFGEYTVGPYNTGIHYGEVCLD